MTLVPTGPQEDTRPPNYAKGQWFGGVPHTRVVVQAIGSWNDSFEALARGILLQMSNSDFTNLNLGFAEWRGTFALPDGRLAVCLYRWSVASEVAGTANFQFRQTFSAGDHELFGALQQTRPVLPAARHIEASIRIPDDPGTPASVVKFDVPEWADVLERWPNVQQTEPF